jgi:hypothetical protein
MNDRLWPIATGDILTARRRLRGIAVMDRFSSRNDLSERPKADIRPDHERLTGGTGMPGIFRFTEPKVLAVVK